MPRRRRAVWACRALCAWACAVLFAASSAVATQARVGAASGSSAFQHVEIVVGLRWRDQSELEALLRGLANPDSALFGRYLSADEFDRRFAPSPETIEATQAIL